MGRVLKPIAVGLLFIGAAFLTGGASIVPSLKAASVSVAGLGTVSVGAVAGGLATTTLGSVLVSLGAGAILSGIGNIFRKPPGIPPSTLGRLAPSFNPNAARPLVLGSTAMATDVIYSEPSGPDDEFVDYIVVHASHRCHAVREMYFDGKLAWTEAGGVQGEFAGYLTVTVRLEGTAGNAVPINGGTTWSSTARCTGMCYSHLRIKRSGNSKNVQSPLPNGLPGQMVVVGDGMPLYDPRRDSTRGGDGPHRADDRSTWAFVNGAVDLGNNPSLQLLSTLLGWVVNDQRMVGARHPIDDVGFTSFVSAANLADELISLVGGGSMPRYRTAGIFRDDMSWREMADVIAEACFGEVDDSTGFINFNIRHNDLADVALDLTDDDLVASGVFEPVLALSDHRNVVSGRYVEPGARYQLAAYPESRLASPDGVERVLLFDQPVTQDQRQAQRVARMRLQSREFSGVFTGGFGPRAAGLQRFDVVTFTTTRLNFVAKKFRVLDQTLNLGSGLVELVLAEEDAAIYANEGDVAAPIIVPPPVFFDARALNPAGPLPWEFVVGDGRPQDGATRNEDSGNLLPQSVSLDDGQGFGGGVIARPIGASGRPAELVRAQLIDDGAGVHWTGPAGVPVSPGDVISYRHYASSDFTNADNCRAKVNFLASDGSIAATIDLPTTELTGAVALSTWFLREARFTVPADVVAMRIYVIRDGGSGGSFFIGEPWASRAEMGADVTAISVPSLDTPAGQTFIANHLGTLNPGQLPRAVQARRRRGGVDVSSSTTWSVTTVNCTATINSIGVVTITDVLGTGSVTVISTREGVELRGAFEIILQTAAPPAGTGGTSASDSSLASIFGNSTWTDISTVLTITTGSAGQAQLSAPLAFGVGAVFNPGLNFFGCQLRWRRETSPGVWTVVKTVSNASDAVVGWDDDFGEFARENGAITCNEMLTGLGASTTHSFQLQAFASTGAGLATFFFGTASAVGS